jgi:hypothetical protein
LTTDFAALLSQLEAGGGEHLVVGGLAANALGMPRTTLDLDVVYRSFETVLFRVRCRSLGREKLIQVKRAAGRPKDLEVVAQLEAMREERAAAGLGDGDVLR